MRDKYKDRCAHCAALVQGDTPDAWACDEKEQDIHEVEHCPEGLELPSDRKGFVYKTAPYTGPGDIMTVDVVKRDDKLLVMLDGYELAFDAEVTRNRNEIEYHFCDTNTNVKLFDTRKMAELGREHDQLMTRMYRMGLDHMLDALPNNKLRAVLNIIAAMS